MNIIQKLKNSEGSKSWGFALPMAGILIGIIGVACAVEWYAGWRGIHEYQSPIVFRMPWYEVELTVISPISNLPVKTEQEIMEQYELSPVLKTIYLLESTSGQNDGCKDEGKVNGFGFAQNGSSWKCYNSFDDVVERVNDWFIERLSVNGNNLIEAVCLYNTGVQYQDSCGDYSANFLSVITKHF